MSSANAVGMLKLAYRAEFPDDRALFYGMALADLPDADVERAVKYLIDTSKFLPSIAEIKDRVAEYALDLPTTEEAWEIAERGRLIDAHPIVQEAVNHVGGRWQILYSDSITTVRAQFRKAYEQLRRRTLDEYRSGQARELPAGLRSLGPTMAELPETTRIRPRPVMARLSARWAGRELAPPTDEEKTDAIDVLREGPMAAGDGYIELDPEKILDPLYQEAERIFEEAGR